MRPHLLSFGARGLVLSGGRLCVENITGLFLWLSADGMAGATSAAERNLARDHLEAVDEANSGHIPGQGKAKGAAAVWQRYSISYYHNRLWPGPSAYRFDERVNASDVFESQAYTGLVRVGPQDFIVTYNKYWDPLYDGMPGCDSTGTTLGCSTAFAMHVSIVDM